MKIGDWILVPHLVKFINNEDLGCIDGKIISLSEKAIQVEWEVIYQDNSTAIKRVWIPKSVISILSTEKNKIENHHTDHYTIMLPDWIKLTVTSRIEKIKDINSFIF